MAFGGAILKGPTPMPGLEAMAAIIEITWDTSSLVTGELLDLTDYFYSIDLIVPAGMSAIGLAGYTPQFCYDSGAVHTSSNLLAVLMINDTDGSYAKEGPMVPANAVDISALGTTYALVFGKAAV
jgi:hypothetical protein